jgi:arylsulfatase A-like enzyme
MKKPNVIVIMTDEQRADAMSCAGSRVVKTPAMDTLAAEGVRFRECFCASPLCVPSRHGFFTGEYQSRTRAFDNTPASHVQLGDLSLVELLKREGYATAIVGKNHTFTADYLQRWFDVREIYGHFGKEEGHFTPSDRAIVDWYADGRRREGLIPGPMPFSAAECPTQRIADDACAFVTQHREKPFFLYYSFPDPHWPNVAPEPWYSHVDPAALAGELEAADHRWEKQPFKFFAQAHTAGCAEFTREERLRVLATAYGQLAFVDHAIGQLLEQLRSLHLYDDTYLVFCSDHGNFMGRYGLIGKTGGFMDCLLRVPMILKVPGTRAGAVVDAPCSNIDITPTLLEALGLAVPGAMQGRSLLPLLRGERDTHREAIFAEVGSLNPPPPPVPREGYAAYHARQDLEHPRKTAWVCDYTMNGRAACIRAEGWKYSTHTGFGEELYDLGADPLELTNLAGLPAHAERQAALAARLLRWSLHAAHGATPE